MKKMKTFRLTQLISIEVEAENETLAINKVRNEPSTYEGWTKWDVKQIN